jgi:hypothetical protein
MKYFINRDWEIYYTFENFPLLSETLWKKILHRIIYIMAIMYGEYNGLNG